MLFLCKRVAVAGAVTDNFACVGVSMANLKLEQLTFGGRFDKLSFNFETSAHSCLRHFSEVCHRAVDHDLQCLATASICELDECEVFATHAGCPGPACDLHDVVNHRLIVLVQTGDANALSI